MKQQEAKTLVLLYIFFFLVIVISFFTYTKSPEYTLFYFPYGIFYKRILYILLILVSLLILFKARKLYSKTNNIAMEIISAGFLAGIILYAEKVLTFAGLFYNAGTSHIFHIFDLLLGDLIWTIALFAAIFYIPRQSEKNEYMGKFIYYSTILYALLIISLDIFVSPYLLDYVYKILPNIFLVKTIEQSFYLLSAFIYIDMRIVNNQKIFSFFTLGLIILGSGPLFFVPEYATTVYAFISPMIKIIGFIFIYIGLQDLQTKPKFLNFRQKLSSYMSLLLILSYITIIPIGSLLFDMKLPSYLSYLFLGYFIALTIAQYILSANFSIPVMDVIRGIEQIKPGQKPELIPVTSHDEIGLLAEEFNKNAELIWEYFEKEKLLKSSIAAIRKTLDIDEVKHQIVSSIGYTFKADRCFVIEYDQLNNKYLPIKYEHLASSEVKSLKNMDIEKDLPEFTKELKERREIIILDADEYIEKNNLKESDLEKYAKKYDIKSGFSLPIVYYNEYLGNLAVHFTRKKAAFREPEVQFSRDLIEQSSIAFYQAKQYEQIKNLAARESVLRSTIETIQTVLDINIIKKILVTEIGKVLDGDMSVFYIFDAEKKRFLPVDENSLYLSSSDIKSIVGINIEDYGWGGFFRKHVVEVIYSDLEKFIDDYNLKGTLGEQFIRDFGLKSTIGIPMQYAGELLGIFAVGYVREKREISREDIELARTAANQGAIAFHQAKLYDSLKTQVRKEYLQRKFTEAIRSTLDIDEFIKIAVNEVGKTFEADRCLFVVFDKKNQLFMPLGANYLSSIEVKEIIDFNSYQDLIAEFVRILNEKGENFISSTSFVLDKTPKIKDTTIRFYREYDIRSGYSVPVWGIEGENAYFVIHFTKKYVELAKDDLDLLKSLANQASIAFYQARLYEKQKNTAQRETLLREIITAFRSTLDMNELKKIVVTTVGKALEADRAFITEYNQDAGYFLDIDKNSEYLKSPDIKSITEIDESAPGYKVFEDIDMAKSVMYFSDFDEYFKDKEIDKKNDYLKQHLKSFNVKSNLGVPIIYRDVILGRLVLHYTKKNKDISPELINLVQTVADQAGIAIYQTKQYIYEKLSRDIISTVRSSLNIDEIEENVVNSIGKALNASRCLISLYDNKKEEFLPIKYEYLDGPDSFSNIGVSVEKNVPELFKHLANAKNLIVSNREEFIKESHLEGTLTAEYLRNANILSGYSVPIKYADELVGILVIHYTKRKGGFSEEQVEFARSLANQIGIGIQQASLYEKERQTAERETVLKNIIMTVRSTYELNKVKKDLVNAIGKALDADRCYIFEVDLKTKTFLPLDEDSEYLSHPEEISLRTLDPYSEGAKYFFKIFEIKKETNYQDTTQFLEEYGLEDTPVKQLLENLNVKSSINIPIFYGDDVLGLLGVTYTRKKFEYTEEDLKFIRVLASQTGIALHQSKLFNETRLIAEREKLLRSIIATIRSTLDINEILRDVCEKVAKVFHVERASIVEYPDPDNYQKYIVHEEYKIRKEINGIKNIKGSYKVAEFWGENLFKNAGIWAIDDIHTSDTPDYFKEFYKKLEVKSIIAAAVKSGEENWGIFALSEIKEFRTWTEEEKTLLKSITDQLFIAIKQGKLYKATRMHADREQLTRKVLEVTRSTLDMKEFITLTIKEVGKTFNADRCFFRILDKKINEYLTPEEEYLSSDQIKSLKEINLEQGSLDYLGDIVFKQGKLRIENTDEFIKKNNLQGSKVEDYFIQSQIKSDYAVTIWDTENKKIHLVLHYCKKPVIFSDDNFNMMQIIAQQSQIGFQQAMFYNEIKQKEEKERILREILTGIKFTRDIDEIYNYLMSRIVQIFNLDIACVFEPPEFIYTKIKHKCLIDNKFTELSEEALPEEFIKQLIDIKDSQEFLVVNNVDEYYENTEIKPFFSNHNIKSFIAAPLVKYDTKTVVLDILFMFSSRIRNWSTRERDLLKSIFDIAITIIWEASKLKEIDDLRNTFILTLTHDFQVPLVGERKALEFLIERPDQQPIGKFKDFISETIKSNKELSRLLIILLESYNYDSGKQTLELKKTHLKPILLKVIDSLRELAESKSMTIDVRVPDDLPELLIDSQEIFKPFYTILENAIVYTEPNGYIVINSLVQENTIATYISDNGSGIPQDIKNILFKRYETALAIERKIGSGLALYLSKQIVEAHKGIISYTSQVGEGSTFCVILPIE